MRRIRREEKKNKRFIPIVGTIFSGDNPAVRPYLDFIFSNKVYQQTDKERAMREVEKKKEKESDWKREREELLFSLHDLIQLLKYDNFVVQKNIPIFH